MLDNDVVNKVYSESDCLVEASQIDQVLDDLARQVTNELQDKNPIILVVMTGGVIPAGHLLTRLDFPLQQDYVHATRYQGETSGAELNWLHKPAIDLHERTILVIDDIFDEGITLHEIVKYCQDKGATEVKSLAFVNKVHDRKISYKPDYIGINVEDRYLFGFGMDYKTYLRNLYAIHAVKGL